MRTIEWNKDHLLIIDQTKLPFTYETKELRTVEEIIDAIYSLAVRGAPAIGVAGAFGVVTALINQHNRDLEAFFEVLPQVCQRLRDTRPTAVNLAWAVNLMERKALALKGESYEELLLQLIQFAESIADEEVENAHAIAEFGQTLIPEEGANIHTHCSTGKLCTVDHGLGMGVVWTAMKRGKRVHVYTDETRPRLQGAKINTFDLKEAGIPFTLITDNTAPFLMKQGKIDMVFISADRVVRNGDVAAKIGVYGAAVVAKENGIPVYCFAPMSTLDFETACGDEIEIEERSPEEVLCINGNYIAPKDTPVLNYAFDVTPAKYWDAIVTDVGIAYPPYEESLLELHKAYRDKMAIKNL
ncbi:MAG: S-methyl-5-thioribose-1-phosphate isomerase [Tissierellia bacterium]|nr:S-methyl-5-thioribose-1-phosphate isomerase [Tissierellia bacterium]